MRTYKITIQYDGTRYQGWQRQQNTPDTIQEIIEKAISLWAGYAVTIDGSGRTDAGVHAKGQTASFNLAGKVAKSDFLTKINQGLPSDIRITNVELVKNGFHARLSAVAKTYCYQIDTREKPDVFSRRYTCHHAAELDVCEMKKAAGYLLGTKDYAAFTDQKEDKSTLRSIYDIDIVQEYDKIYLYFYGSGFLYHMVRILAGTLLEVGDGRKTAKEISDIIQSKDRKRAGFLAPAQGLFLQEVFYHKASFLRKDRISQEEAE